MRLPVQVGFPISELLRHPLVERNTLLSGFHNEPRVQGARRADHEPSAVVLLGQRRRRLTTETSFISRRCSSTAASMRASACCAVGADAEKSGDFHAPGHVLLGVRRPLHAICVVVGHLETLTQAEALDGRQMLESAVVTSVTRRRPCWSLNVIAHVISQSGGTSASYGRDRGGFTGGDDHRAEPALPAGVTS